MQKYCRISMKQNVFIRTKELQRLLSHSDLPEVNEAKELVKNVFAATKIYIVLQLFYYSTLFGIFLITQQDGFAEDRDSIVLIVFLSVLLVAMTIAYNFHLNYRVNYRSTKFVHRQLNMFRAEFSVLIEKYFPVEFNKFYSVMQNYWFQLSVIQGNFVFIIFTFMMLIFADVSSSVKIYFMLLAFMLIVIITILGYLFANASMSLYLANTKANDTRDRDVAARVGSPLAFNLAKNTIIPIAVLVTASSSLHPVVPFLVFLGSFITYSWVLVMDISDFAISKRNLRFINSQFDELTSKYVLNNDGFKRQCGLCESYDELDQRSRENSSLILERFVSMSVTDGHDSDRNISYEFMPGLYQLNGSNGVGKTTFLQAITQPSERLTEYCSGYASLQGSSLFCSSEDLNGHRKKFVYLGRNTDISQLDFDLNGNDCGIEEFVNLNEYFMKLKGRYPESFSEGERAIYLIVTNLSHLSMRPIVVIDELLSRVYEDDDLKLRSELIGAIKKATSKSNSIVIVVDHSVRLVEAKQVRMRFDDKVGRVCLG